MTEPFWSDGWFWGAAALALAALLGGRRYLRDRKTDQRQEREDHLADLARRTSDPPVDMPPEKNWPEIITPGLRLTRAVQGREDDVVLLHEKLTAASRTAIVPGVAVKGTGGMGKTTLARYYVQRYRHLYRGIWWLRAQTSDTLIEDLGKLIGPLDISVLGQTTPEALAQAVVMELGRQSDPWLLIYDNAERAQDLAD